MKELCLAPCRYTYIYIYFGATCITTRAKAKEKKIANFTAQKTVKCHKFFS